MCRAERKWLRPLSAHRAATAAIEVGRRWPERWRFRPPVQWPRWEFRFLLPRAGPCGRVDLDLAAGPLNLYRGAGGDVATFFKSRCDTETSIFLGLRLTPTEPFGNERASIHLRQRFSRDRPILGCSGRSGRRDGFGELFSPCELAEG